MIAGKRLAMEYPYKHRVEIPRGLSLDDQSAIRSWLRARAANYECEHYPRASFYRFSNPDVAMEFKVRWV